MEALARSRSSGTRSELPADTGTHLRFVALARHDAERRQSRLGWAAGLD
jgi:hypothetical protein